MLANGGTLEDRVFFGHWIKEKHKQVLKLCLLPLLQHTLLQGILIATLQKQIPLQHTLQRGFFIETPQKQVPKSIGEIQRWVVAYVTVEIKTEIKTEEGDLTTVIIAVVTLLGIGTTGNAIGTSCEPMLR